MLKIRKKKKSSAVIAKSMQYSVICKIVNFNPDEFSSKTIIVDGKAAVLLKGRIYREVKG